MSGWVPMPTEGWPDIAAALSASGAVWPEPAVVVDLRWHVDQRARQLFAQGVRHPTPAQLVAGIPGRPTLRRRWGWTDYRVRTLLADTVKWWDERRGARPGVADRQRSDSEPTASRQWTASATTDEPAEVADFRQSTDSEPTVDRQRTSTGALESQPQPQPQPQGHTGPPTGSKPPRRRRSGSTKHPAFDEVAAIYADRVQPALQSPMHNLTSHTASEPAAMLNSALHKQGRDRIVRMLQYVAQADDDPAGGANFLRERRFPLTTLLQPKKLDQRCDMADTFWRAHREGRARLATSRQTAAASTRGANPDDDDPSRAYLRDWRPDPLPGMEGR